MQQRPSYRLALLPLLAAAFGMGGGAVEAPAAPSAPRTHAGYGGRATDTASAHMGYSRGRVYFRKTGTTPSDLRDLAAAEAKRERKNARRLAEACAA